MLSLRKSLWLVLVFPVLFVECPYLTGAEPRYRMEGVVTDGETNLPVAGAMVQVLVEVQSDRILQSQTDREGRYVIKLPAGHARTWRLTPPDGYFLVGESAPEAFATTPDAPVHTRNYQVKRGSPIRFSVKYPADISKRPQIHASLSQEQANEHINAVCVLDEQGHGTITLQRLVGKFDVRCGEMSFLLRAPEGMSADFEEGFDPDQVQPEVLEEGEEFVVRDGNGKTVRLRGCHAQIDGTRLTIAIPLETTHSSQDFIQLKGRIVDTESNGIADVSVAVAFYFAEGTSYSDLNHTVLTDSRGHFTFPVPRQDAVKKVSVSLNSPGYAAQDTKPKVFNSDGEGTINLGVVTMKAGCSLPVRVTAPDGSPLHGAVVEPTNSYASRTRIERTGPEGECVLTDLAPGLTEISARFGNLVAHTRVSLKPGENELYALQLAPVRSRPVQAAEQNTPLAVGTSAPEWKIQEWSDGEERKLSDFRGKVVLLEFWGIWCSPCINAIPVMKELHERYRDRDVVFLSIHTAGEEMSRVKRMLKDKDWNVLAGLDVEEANGSGETVRRYAIQGFPTLILIDRNGNIAMNSSIVPGDHEEMMRKMETIAKSIGLTWPMDQNADQEELQAWSAKLQVELLSREIEAALKIEQK